MSHFIVLLLESERRGIIREWFAPLRRWVVDTAHLPQQAVNDWSSLVYTLKWCAIITAASVACLTLRKAFKG